jgi:hypothetical protein
MRLLGGVGCGGDAADDSPSILASGLREHKDWWRRWLGNSSGCGEKDMRDRAIAVRVSVMAADP